MDESRPASYGGNLTYELDKLVAIAGLARYLHPLWPDPTTEYLAGLWSHETVHGRLWYRNGPVNSSSRPEQYRTPSWSWAAINGEIGFRFEVAYCGTQLAIIQKVKKR